MWVQRYDGAGGARAFSVAVSPTAGTVFVTGYSGEVSCWLADPALARVTASGEHATRPVSDS